VPRVRVISLSETSTGENNSEIQAVEVEEELLENQPTHYVVDSTRRFIMKYYGDEKLFTSFLSYTIQRDKNSYSAFSYEQFHRHFRTGTGNTFFQYHRLLDIVKKCYEDCNIPYRTITSKKKFPRVVKQQMFLEFYNRYEAFKDHQMEFTENQNNEEPREAKVDVIGTTLTMVPPVEQRLVPTLTETVTGLPPVPQYQNQGKQCWHQTKIQILRKKIG